FLDADATRQFLEDTENIPSGREVGTVVYSRREGEYWFAVFTYSDSGHVDDSDRDDIDADALLRDMQEATEEDNRERVARGWATLQLDGWSRRPYYDLATNNLTWGTWIRSNDDRGVNHSVRLLGRTGVMSVQLVADA